MTQPAIQVRFNYGRKIASFDNREALEKWVKTAANDLYQPFMYTIHGIGEVTDVMRLNKTL